jgi:hypothetical protein
MAVVFALMFLLLTEWFADRFAGWLAKRWSMSRGQDAIPPITPSLTITMIRAVR